MTSQRGPTRPFPFLCLLAAVSAGAQTALPDPTRPPAGLQGGNTEATAVPDALVLQSVLLGPGRIPAAVISGQLVELGGTVGGARLARVTPHSVLLQGTQGTTTLTLMPEGQKTKRIARMELPK